MRLSHQVQGLSKEFITSFISGMRNNARVELMAKQSQSVLEAIRLARMDEEKVLMIKKPSKISSQRSGISSTAAVQNSQGGQGCRYSFLNFCSSY